jgi:ribosomal protein S18 acetylase RimI-like enzyme
MRISRYKPEYGKGVQKLIKTVLFEIFGKHKINPFENFEAYAVCYVALDKDRVVASIALRKDKDAGEHIGIVKRLYVYKDYRNKGLAQKLYDRIEVFAKKDRIHRLQLSTTPQMVDAIRFYKKNGFRKIREEKESNKIFFRKVLE